MPVDEIQLLSDRVVAIRFERDIPVVTKSADGPECCLTPLDSMTDERLAIESRPFWRRTMILPCGRAISVVGLSFTHVARVYLWFLSFRSRFGIVVEFHPPKVIGTQLLVRCLKKKPVDVTQQHKNSLFMLDILLHLARRCDPAHSQRHVLLHCHGLRDGDKKAIDLPDGHITVVDTEHVRCKRGTSALFVLQHRCAHKVQVWEERCRDHGCKASEHATMLLSRKGHFPHFTIS